VVELAVDGEVDVATAGPLRDALTAVLNESGITRLVVDFTKVDFLDSTGISALVAAHRLAQANRTQFLVINCQPQALRVLEITGVDRLLTDDTGPITA
jgi:anti-sigma B factor antagonist